MDPYAERTPSLTNSDSSSTSTSSTSLDPVSMDPAIYTDRDRPLPSLPRELSRKSYHIPFPIPKEKRAYPTDSLRSSRRSSLVHDRPPQPASSKTKSLAWKRMHRAAVYALKQPHVLETLLQFIPWTDLYALLSTCADMRRLWDTRDIRDVILSHFVPGYSYALRYRDLSNYQDMDISLQDLDLLYISQRVPLHQYPVHSLRSISSLTPSRDYDATTAKLTHKLAVLCLTHSRFVLLLQSLVHSSPLPLPVDQDTQFQPARFSSISPPLPHGLRELTFPAPLSYVSDTSDKTPSGAYFPGTGSDPRRSMISPRDGASSSRLSHESVPRGRNASKSRVSADLNPPINQRKQRKLSIFGARNPPPPPASEPRSLKYYDARWRRTVAGSQTPVPVQPSAYASNRTFFVRRRHQKVCHAYPQTHRI